ncbi:integrase arm-type DNA-binding domain-containing protein [Celeribacter halophilus]|uniref:Integrase arm-type DNA-binding domain-containing protein n=1 Tax=Celeribacter halophilus TaxID=576117 RepID=A0AAW7XUR1_9RHOB|nr:integrase arm-type DNA-binding domain-containing protein [Celeribacter halophilus]MDO6458042.1 integrase arm-type DNA-binding domain-containing protein [Celeribacter halophilus]
MAKALTTKAVEAMKPTPNKRTEVPDPALSGLYLIIQPSGAKSWALRYRAGNKPKKLTLGKWPVMGVADARTAATEAIEAIEKGRDPSAEKKAEKSLRMSGDNTFKSQLETFHKRHLKDLKTGEAVMQSLRFNVLPVWADRDVSDITRRDIVLLLDSIVDDGRSTTANRVKAYLSKFFGWCADRGVIEQSPTIGLKPPAKEKPRDRPFEPEEIRLLWIACEAEANPWGALFKILLLTGQRRGEVARMQWRDIDDNGVWILSSTKNNEKHSVPLPRAAQEIIFNMPRTGPFIFTTNGTAPALSLSKPTKRIAARMIEIASKEAGEPVEIPHWKPHDLRHTVKTGLADLGFGLDIRSRVMNHISDLPKMDLRYNHHDYDDENRRALEAWAGHVAAIVDGSSQADNVVRLG